jgi:hypothetical protein
MKAFLDKTAYTKTHDPEWDDFAIDVRPELGFISTGGNFMTIGWVKESGIWKPLVPTPENPWGVPEPAIE